MWVCVVCALGIEKLGMKETEKEKKYIFVKEKLLGDLPGTTECLWSCVRFNQKMYISSLVGFLLLQN